MIYLKDTIKEGMRERFDQLRAMGIRTIMITGDNRLTAAKIAEESGVDDFLAEATPEAKLALIREQQAAGRLVAMTGDGTNDAPALAQADVGVAMNTGTQAAREAGNMVDLDSNPTKLIEIVEVGKQLLITRGALTTFSIANDVAKYFAILPAIFVTTWATSPGGKGPLHVLNIMNLGTPAIGRDLGDHLQRDRDPAADPDRAAGVSYRPIGASALLRRNLLIYGLGGIIAPFIGIKLIDLLDPQRLRGLVAASGSRARSWLWCPTQAQPRSAPASPRTFTAAATRSSSGMAAGVGKTYRMLQEGQAEAEAGRDVVIGYLEPHGREETTAQAEGLEVVPRRRVTYRDAVLEEMDLPAIIRRAPELCLIDELAHTNVPGVEHAKRCEDIDDVLEAGIDVFSTVNVQHLESLNDQVAELTGIRVRETVPDSVIGSADEVVLIDITPQSLIERLLAGKVYPGERVQAALNNFFKLENLVGAARGLAAPGGRGGREQAHPLGQRGPRPRGAPDRHRRLTGDRRTAAGAHHPAPRSQRIVRRAWRSAQRLGAELDLLWVRRTTSRPTRSASSSRRCGAWPACSARTCWSSGATTSRSPPSGWPTSGAPPTSSWARPGHVARCAG